MASASTTANPPSGNFQPRIYGVGAWTDNLHFAYDVVATLRPRLLVELGTDRGESYFAFCQSATENTTGTRCFAVDTWQGDEHAGGYDETTFAEVSTHNAAHYAAFSTLLRSSFDEALPRFADGSIDLLHLDGLHTEMAVGHDLAQWLPKLSPGGILLLHDVSVRQRGFGVWKVWEDRRTRGRSYTFSEGPGLGVWQKPPTTSLPDPLEALLSGGAAGASFAEYYGEQARATQEKIRQHWRDRSIRETAAAHQTIVQVFHTRAGAHREEDSVHARLGHGSWRDLIIALPSGAGAAPLRIDFVSTFTVIEIASLSLHTGDALLFTATKPEDFAPIQIAGDADRLPDSNHLRLQVTGPDPQLYLPVFTLPEDATLQLKLRMRVIEAAD